MTIMNTVQTAGGFDVERATRAYLNLLQGPARANSDSYFEGGYRLVLWDAVAAAITAGAILSTGWSAGGVGRVENASGMKPVERGLASRPNCGRPQPVFVNPAPTVV